MLDILLKAQQEIDSLRNENQRLTALCDGYRGELDKLKEEVAELREEVADRTA